MNYRIVFFVGISLFLMSNCVFSQDKEKYNWGVELLSPKKIPVLVASLKSKDAEVRRRAVRALGNLYKRALPALPALIGALEDPHWAVKSEVIEALGKIASPRHRQRLIPLVMKFRRHAHWRVRAAVIGALGRLAGGDAHLIREILNGFYDTHFWVRQEAARALIEANLPTFQGMYELKRGLTDVHWLVRLQTLRVLDGWKGLSHFPVSLLVGSLVDLEYSVRLLASRVVAHFGKRVLPALRKLLRASRRQDRLIAVRTLARIAQKEPLALSFLLDVLQKDSSVRGFVILSLGKLKRYAVQISQHLKPWVLSKDISLIQSAAWALGELGATSLPVMKELLKRGTWKAKLAILQVMFRCKERALVATPQLVELLLDRHWRVRREAAWLLLRLGRGTARYLGKRELKILQRSQMDRLFPVKLASIRLLGWMGRRAHSAKGIIRRYAKHRDTRISRAALEALFELGIAR